MTDSLTKDQLKLHEMFIGDTANIPEKQRKPRKRREGAVFKNEDKAIEDMLDRIDELF